MWRWIILSTLTVQGLYISPFYVGTLVDELNFTASQAGLISGCEYASVALAGILIFFTLDRLNWRNAILFCAITSAAANLLCIGIDDFTSVLTLRVVVSLCAGSLYSLAFALLGRSTQPERSFGWSMTMQSILAACYLLLLPYLIKQWGITAIYTLEMATILPCVGLVIQLQQKKSITNNRISKLGISIITTLSGLVFFSIAQGALWAFIERIGKSVNIETEYIGITLTAATILGIAGGFASAIQGNKFGRQWSLKLVFFGQTLAILLLWVTPDPVFYLIAICLFNFLWIYAIAFQLGIVADKDSSGKSCALATTFQALGLAIGAVAAGSLLELRGNFDMVYLTIVISGAISLYLMIKETATSEKIT